MVIPFFRKKGNKIFNNLRVGWFLALRQIRRANRWTTILIVFIMTLTFLNLVVVSGILVGSIQGAVNAVGDYYLGDVFVSALKNKDYIEESQDIVKTAKNISEVEAVSARYITSGKIRSDYKKIKKPSDLEESVVTLMTGIDPKNENSVTNISDLIIEGEYLNDDDYDKVLVGAMLLKKYSSFESASFPVIDNVEVGSKILVEMGGISREVRVKGILKSKVDEIDRRIFFVDSQLRNLINRFDYNADEISIKLKDGSNAVFVKNSLLAAGLGDHAKIQTMEDAEPKFIKDLKKTFAMLGNVISSIGLAVTAITIFIVIFINAVTRRRFIGILKGIGMGEGAIEISYIIQSIFYALIGSAIGLILIFGFLKPYFMNNPIDFPFGDGILVANWGETMLRAFLLFITTIIAGYIPAKLIVRKNTLDSILGRY